MAKPESMNIHLVQGEDVETLFEIRTSVKENYQSRQEIAKLGITPASVAKMLDKECCAWIAEVKSQPVGFSIANLTEKTILGLFVLPEFENQGIGRALMEITEDWFKKQGIKEISLLTGNDPTFRAYGFYLHLGWTAVGLETEGVMKGEMKFARNLTY